MFKLAHDRVGAVSVDDSPAALPIRPKHAGRREMLDQICQFVLDHELEVNPANLTLAQAVVSGSAFAAALATAARAARAANAPLSVAVCNIDRFTAINDSHGHDAGDRVIQAIARVLHRISDNNCHLAPHDDKDFAVLFPGLTAPQAADQLDHARETFAQRKLVDRKTHLAIGSVTFSGGLVDVLAYVDPQTALRAADEALQTAKNQGRNRVVVGNQSEPKNPSSLAGGSPQG